MDVQAGASQHNLWNQGVLFRETGICILHSVSKTKSSHLMEKRPACGHQKSLSATMSRWITGQVYQRCSFSLPMLLTLYQVGLPGKVPSFLYRPSFNTVAFELCSNEPWDSTDIIWAQPPLNHKNTRLRKDLQNLYSVLPIDLEICVWFLWKRSPHCERW